MDGQCVSKHIRAENREIFAIGKKPSKQEICRVFPKKKATGVPPRRHAS
jgi:hypothetical protein